MTTENQLVAASVLSRDPPIFYVRPRPKPLGLAGLLAERLGGRLSVCIVRTMWSLESPVHLRQLTGACRQFMSRHPNMKIVVAANTPRELAMLGKRGIHAVLANHNIFVDETVFRPLAHVVPTYDAVYNASFSAFKRRELARELRHCAHICHPAEPDHKSDPLAAAKAQLPHHSFVNPVSRTGLARLSPQQVNHILAQSHVGLCLSAAEGAMTASMEYLLAGLPVVTTPNLGGRSRYFHRETSICVNPDPRQIRDCVELLKARKLPRDFVRAKTLELVQKDRDRFNDFIQGLRAGFPPLDGDPRWSFRYVNNLYEWRTADGFAAQLGLGPEQRAAE